MGHQMIRLMHLIFNSNQFSNSLQSKNRADGAKQGATNQFGIGKNPKYRKNGKKRDFFIFVQFHFWERLVQVLRRLKRKEKRSIKK